MLFPGLQGHAQGLFFIYVDGDADDAAGHVSLVAFPGGKVGRMGPSVENRNTKTLAGSNHHIGSPFTGGGEQHQAHEIRSNGHGHFTGVRFFRKGPVVPDLPIRCRVLHQAAKEKFVFRQVRISSEDQFNTQWLCPGYKHIPCLRENIFVNEEMVSTGFCRGPRTGIVQHDHGFGSGCSFIQQGGIGNLHPGEIHDHRLEIQQCFQPSL